MDHQLTVRHAPKPVTSKSHDQYKYACLQVLHCDSRKKIRSFFTTLRLHDHRHNHHHFMRRYHRHSLIKNACQWSRIYRLRLSLSERIFNYVVLSGQTTRCHPQKDALSPLVSCSLSESGPRTRTKTRSTNQKPCLCRPPCLPFFLLSSLPGSRTAELRYDGSSWPLLYEPERLRRIKSNAFSTL